MYYRGFDVLAMERFWGPGPVTRGSELLADLEWYQGLGNNEEMRDVDKDDVH